MRRIKECQKCHKATNLTKDHIFRRAWGGKAGINGSNLQYLCWKCHTKKEKIFSVACNYLKRPLTVEESIVYNIIFREDLYEFKRIGRRKMLFIKATDEKGNIYHY